MARTACCCVMADKVERCPAAHVQGHQLFYETVTTIGRRRTRGAAARRGRSGGLPVTSSLLLHVFPPVHTAHHDTSRHDTTRHTRRDDGQNTTKRHPTRYGGLIVVTRRLHRKSLHMNAFREKPCTRRVSPLRDAGGTTAPKVSVARAGLRRFPLGPHTVMGCQRRKKRKKPQT